MNSDRTVQTSANVEVHEVSLYEKVPRIDVGHVTAAADSVPKVNNKNKIRMAMQKTIKKFQNTIADSAVFSLIQITSLEIAEYMLSR